MVFRDKIRVEGGLEDLKERVVKGVDIEDDYGIKIKGEVVGGDDLKELVECGGRWGEWNEGMGEMGDDGFGVVDGLGVGYERNGGRKEVLGRERGNDRGEERSGRGSGEKRGEGEGGRRGIYGEGYEEGD